VKPESFNVDQGPEEFEMMLEYLHKPVHSLRHISASLTPTDCYACNTRVIGLDRGNVYE
jgi:hypothetical protein